MGASVLVEGGVWRRTYAWPLIMQLRLRIIIHRLWSGETDLGYLGKGADAQGVAGKVLLTRSTYRCLVDKVDLIAFAEKIRSKPGAVIRRLEPRLDGDCQRGTRNGVGDSSAVANVRLRWCLHRGRRPAVSVA